VIVPVPRSQDVPATAASSNVRLFRGLSAREERARDRGGFTVKPWKPLLQRPEDWFSFDPIFCGDGLRFLHVVDQLRDHSVSVSGTFSVSDFYASSTAQQPYGKPGDVVVLYPGKLVHAVGLQGRWPLLSMFDSGVVLLDPRAPVSMTRTLERYPIETEMLRSRALVDDELLLVHGEIVPWQTVRVPAGRRSKPHLPWIQVEMATGFLVPRRLRLPNWRSPHRAAVAAFM
jgi:hypothetical protein